MRKTGIAAFCALALALLPILSLAQGSVETLPVLSIQTEGGQDVVSKTEYLPCTVTAENCEVEFAFGGLAAQIRGRGNSTWLKDKKPFKLKFQKKINLLGVGDGPAKKWVLLANHYDKSMIRNHVALYLASHLSNIPVSGYGKFVELYLNGEYWGVYYLCEQVEVGKYRVPVDDSLEGDGNGCLVEMDMYLDDNDPQFTIGNKIFTVKSDVHSEEQLAYVNGLIDQLDTAIFQDDEEWLQERLDVPSLVDVYLVHEFMKNVDAGLSSFYLYVYENDDVYHFGPVWDFDGSSGNNYLDEDGGPEGLMAGAYHGDLYTNDWLVELMNMDWFVNAVRQRWAEIQPQIADAIEEGRRVSALYEAAFAKNFQRWPVLNERIHLEPDALLSLDSCRAQADWLLDFLEKRQAWLTECFSGDELLW